MKKFILVFLTLILLSSCKINEKPEFLRVDKVDVVSANLNTISLEADAIFLNHNHLGGTLKTDNIDVYIDEHLIAKVSTEEFKVPAQNEFAVPLSVNFDTAKLLEDKEGDLLGSLINQFLNRKVLVQFKGDLVYRVAGYSSSYSINHVEEIEIK